MAFEHLPCRSHRREKIEGVGKCLVADSAVPKTVGDKHRARPQGVFYRITVFVPMLIVPYAPSTRVVQLAACFNRAYTWGSHRRSFLIGFGQGRRALETQGRPAPFIATRV